MRRYRTIVRVVFGVVFVTGAVVHLVLGRVYPEGYAVFGQSALWPGLERWWTGAVMPSIGPLTLLVAGIELAIGVGFLVGNRTARLAAVAALYFFAFILALGYGLETTNALEDLLMNRAFTLVMAGLVLPLVLPAGHRGRSEPTA